MSRFTARVGKASVRGQFASTAQGYATRSAREGMSAILNNYNTLINHIEGSTPHILLEALRPTFDKSQVYCPVDKGDLKASGYLEIVESRLGRIRVEIGYAKGGDPYYAVDVHENLEWRHKEPTRAKWLQIALEEDAQSIQARILNAYKEMLI